MLNIHINFIWFIERGGWGGWGGRYVCWGAHSRHMLATIRTIEIMVAGNLQRQSNLCTFQLTVSKVVGNRVTKTALAKTTADQRDHISLWLRARHDLPVHTAPGLLLWNWRKWVSVADFFDKFQDFWPSGDTKYLKYGTRWDLMTGTITRRLLLPANIACHLCFTGQFGVCAVRAELPSF